ncbi:MAG: sensor histidine kinase [Candidatus Velamenicoccus archaeovorus]
MEGLRRSGRPRLVLRFAVGALVAVVATGIAVSAVVIRTVRERAEQAATFHARFVTDAVLAPGLADVDLGHPLTGDVYTAVDDFVRARILSTGRDVRVKLWRLDGTIVYSDAPELVGKRFEDEAAELSEVAEGHVESGVSDLDAEENQLERLLADKLFYTYVPLRLVPGGPVVAVAELYQRYSVIQGDIDRLVRSLLPTLGLGLLLLYAALLPIARNASRRLRDQNDRLNELLEQQERTVTELRDLNQKKDDFVAAASHELRTPLTSIMGYLTTLRQPGLGDDPEVRAEFLGAAEGQAKRLLRLVQNLLSAAHLETGTRPVALERVDLGLLARELVAELAGSRKVELRIPHGAVAVTDRGRIAEVLGNLLDNALKYSPEDAAVELGAEVGPATFRVWVADRGIGIAPEEREVIFDRFHQADQSATRRFGGVGLGLHLAKGMIEELGGRIEVESAPGAGSVFTIVVPMIDAARAAALADASVAWSAGA